MNIKKVAQGSVLAVAACALIATPTFAVCNSSNLNKTYPNLSTDDKNGSFPVMCTGAKTSDGKQIYGKTQAACANAGSLSTDSAACDGNQSDLMKMVRTIINALIGAMGVISVVMIILGGLSYATSQGESSKVQKGKNTIMYGIIGLVISLLAVAIVNFVLSAIQG